MISPDQLIHFGGHVHAGVVYANLTDNWKGKSSDSEAEESILSDPLYGLAKTIAEINSLMLARMYKKFVNGKNRYQRTHPKWVQVPPPGNEWDLSAPYLFDQHPDQEVNHRLIMTFLRYYSAYGWNALVIWGLSKESPADARNWCLVGADHGTKPKGVWICECPAPLKGIRFQTQPFNEKEVGLTNKSCAFEIEK